MLRAGGGPDVAFRAYLLTAVRRLHVDRIRVRPHGAATDDIAAYDPARPSTTPPSTGFESGAAAKAFASLPERWQVVLWHPEVEGEKPADIAPLLGMSANGVSALAYRAREGLRQAYLQQHLADVAGDRCRWATERLGAYVRGGLTKRETARSQSTWTSAPVHRGVPRARRGQLEPRRHHRPAAAGRARPPGYLAAPAPPAAGGVVGTGSAGSGTRSPANVGAATMARGRRRRRGVVATALAGGGTAARPARSRR